MSFVFKKEVYKSLEVYRRRQEMLVLPVGQPLDEQLPLHLVGGILAFQLGNQQL